MTEASSDRRAADVAEEVSRVLEPIFERLHAIAAEVVAARPRSGAGWAEPHLAPVQRLVQTLVGEDDVFVGMGFVAAPGMVDQQERYMLWFQRNQGRTSRLRLNFDPSSIDVYDYLEMDWFQLPAAGRATVATGPYVDYAGSELYIVTATVPVVADGQFLGVAGSDLLFSELERRIVKVLRTVGSDAVLVNTERRIVAANSPEWVLGSRVPTLPEPGEPMGPSTCRDVAELPLGTGWRVALVDDADEK